MGDYKEFDKYLLIFKGNFHILGELGENPDQKLIIFYSDPDPRDQMITETANMDPGHWFERSHTLPNQANPSYLTV